MKILDKYNDPDLGKKMIYRVKSVAQQTLNRLGRPIVLIFYFGVEECPRSGWRGYTKQGMDIQLLSWT